MSSPHQICAVSARRQPDRSLAGINRSRSRRRSIASSALCVMSLSAMSSAPSPVAAFVGILRRAEARARGRCLRQKCRSSSLLSTTDDTITSNNDLLLQQRSEILRGNSKLSLAPMMEYTDRHYRHLVRLLSNKTLLYTEMVAANAIAHERKNALSSSLNGDEGEQSMDVHNSASLVDVKNFDSSLLLRFLGQGHNSEGPSVLQLGGSDPDQLYLAARTVHEFNQLQQMQNQGRSVSEKDGHPPIHCEYTSLNLNCGCPSPKVAGKGCFGAALMQDPALVRQITTSLHKGCDGSMPITVKCRIGTDEGYSFTKDEYLSRSEEEEYQSLKRFVEVVASDGVVTDFQIHARIAVLGKSYSPSDNRKVPPLRYHHVRRLAQEFPELNISLNGGVDTLSGVKRELDECGALEGVMVGRGFVANPWAFAMADEVLYPDMDHSLRPKNRVEVLEAYGRHADFEEDQWEPIKMRRFLTKAIAHLFAGEPNAKRYRIALDEIAGLPKKFAKELRQNPNAVIPMQRPLSELIMDAANTHLSEEVLYRTPEESYDKLLWEEEQANRKQDVVYFGGKDTQQSLVQEWQKSRKEDEMRDEGEKRIELN
ncbi:hypothetical protein ACHAWF_017447 [Thalassiosira exigua]